jgi:RNA-binding protein 39
VLLGVPIIAQLTEAEKNRQARNPVPTASNQPTAPYHRLYVGNVHFSITEEDLTNVFEPFGELEFVQLQKDETGRSKGFAFVQYIVPPTIRVLSTSTNRLNQIRRGHTSRERFEQNERI